MMNSLRLEEMSREAARKAAKDADDLETAALRAGLGVSVPLDESVYDQQISDEDLEAEAADIDDFDREEADPVADVTAQEVQAEELVSAAAKVVLERQKLLGDIYPFRLNDNRVEYVGSKTLVYELCLAIANVNVSKNPYKKLQVAFERLAGAAMSSMLGPGARFVRTGYPPAEDGEISGEPQSFEEAVKWLDLAMPGEWLAEPNTSLNDAKDGGLDVVVWKRFDVRQGSLIYVGNCGCGKNWLKEKKHYVRSSEELQKLLARPKVYHLQDFFCVPFHIAEARDWHEACEHGYFVLDRIRLALAAESAAEEDWVAKGQAFDVMRALIEIAGADLKPSRAARAA
jgi:hypothetical protein